MTPYNHGIVIPNQHVAVVPSRYGTVAVNRHDIFIGAAVEYYGEFSEIEASFLRALINDGDCVLDIGANMGLHTVMFSRCVGDRGLVIAFEPQDALYSLLRAQIALNSLRNVRAYDIAIGAEEGEMWCPYIDYCSAGSFGSLSMMQKPNGPFAMSITMKTIDDLHIPKPSLIKIDVEGMELDVLIGATETIKKDSPILYVENDRREKSEELISYILDLDYRIWWHLPPLFNPDNYFGERINKYPGIVSANMICIRNGDKEFSDLLEIKSHNDPYPLPMVASN